MVFNEIYSAYYNTVAQIITHIISDGAKEKDLQKIVSRYAFGESALTILPSLKSGKWQLLNRDMTTPLEHVPTMPLTCLEKRWLKAISLDKRIKLFGIDLEGLEDVEPLFGEDDYYIYDKYGDGDPYEDEYYIRHFKIILEAMKNKLPIKVDVTDRQGRTLYCKCVPLRLEYSEKDDKFRVFTGGCRYMHVINLAKITKCQIYQGEHIIKPTKAPEKMSTLTLEINDERNALERVMLHFAHFEKQAECVGKRKYRLRIRYNTDDESEIVIRILSFGPMVRVIEPESLVKLIIEKLKKQQNCGLK